MDTDVREAAERLMKPEPADNGAGMWRQAKRITTDYQDVARHVLAEMDATLADEEFFRSIGVIVGATHPDSGATTFPVRSGPHWTGAIVHNGRTVLMVDVSPSGTTIHNPTRGQVLTALRLFGIPVKRSEK